MSFNPEIPVYIQIVDLFHQRLCTGDLKPGDKIQPVRELALNLKVNPNTLQKALAELEREGLLYTERTTGRFVTTDKEAVETMKVKVTEKAVRKFIEEMRALGYTIEEISELVKKNGENNGE